MERLEYRFEDPELLARALTHASAQAEGLNSRSYERLEFLGDRVLGLVTANMLFDAFPEADEGALHRRHNQLVRKEACARVAEALGLGAYLILGQGERQSGGRAKTAILADACEAVIAAIYLDGGYDAAANFIERNWNGAMKGAAKPARDAKSALQEWAQARGLPPPLYELARRSGPDHAPSFSVRAKLPGVEPVDGKGRSKREAEHAAAQAMLKRLRDKEGSDGQA